MSNERIPDNLIPPLRFTTIQTNLYRGGYPREVNFPFLETLELKTIISLTPNPITSETDPKLYEFIRKHSINLVHLECAPAGKGKKRGVPLDYHIILTAINYIIHNKYQPIYIHCLNGGQVTSLLIACLRKLQFWSLISIFNEFIQFTGNITVNDRNFVEGFKGDIIIDPNDKVDWLWEGVSKHIIGTRPKLKVIESKIY
ncbi:OCA6 [[Candida] subhashii]|uniref:OCA6 n=1 Tax=[Candida] subhashii TaxID=561895 RepID=A0A8J5QHL1_9ASCO|nr:OCA6 [[Candida] subhashii]KAG7662184.1 OCA6 [[Candida] subhashii]